MTGECVRDECVNVCECVRGECVNCVYERTVCECESTVCVCEREVCKVSACER